MKGRQIGENDRLAETIADQEKSRAKGDGRFITPWQVFIRSGWFVTTLSLSLLSEYAAGGRRELQN